MHEGYVMNCIGGLGGGGAGGALHCGQLCSPFRGEKKKERTIARRERAEEHVSFLLTSPPKKITCLSMSSYAMKKSNYLFDFEHQQCILHGTYMVTQKGARLG